MFNRWLSLSLLILLCISPANYSNGQDRSQSDSDDSQQQETVKPGMQISTGIGLSGRGFETHVGASLVDELGFQHDVISLARHEQVAEVLKLTEEQQDEMFRLHRELIEEIKSELPGIIAGSVEKEKIEERFHEVEAQILETLEDQQVSRLQQARFQLSIQHHGIEKVVGTEGFRKLSGLGDQQIEQLKTNVKKIVSEKRAALENLVRQANRGLVNRLGENKSEKFKELLGAKYESSLIDMKLFANDRRRPMSGGLNRSMARKLLLSSKFTKQHELNDDQLDRIRQLKSVAENEEFFSTVKDILNESQLAGFLVTVVMQQAKHGTANAIVRGMVSNHLDLSKDEATEIFEYAEQLDAELQKQILKLNAEFDNRTLNTLTDKQGEPLLGDRIGFSDER